VLKSVPLIAGAIISTNAVAQNLFAQAKLTHEAAKYQDNPKDGQQCSGCVQFWRLILARWWRIRSLQADGAQL